jgi:hypothetical protein
MSKSAEYADPAEVVYFDESEMTQPDRTEINGLITASEQRMKSKRWGDWAKESVVLMIVLGGSGFIIHDFIPAQIGSQTSNMASDVATLKSDVGTIKGNVQEIRKDIKDQLSKALDAARQEIQNGHKSGGQHSSIRFGDRIIEAAKAFRVELDSKTLSAYSDTLMTASKFTNTELGQQAWQSTLTLASYKSLFSQSLDSEGHPIRPDEASENMIIYFIPTPSANEQHPLVSSTKALLPKKIGAIAAHIGEDLNPDKSGDQGPSLFPAGADQPTGYPPAPSTGIAELESRLCRAGGFGRSEHQGVGRGWRCSCQHCDHRTSLASVARFSVHYGSINSWRRMGS